ncbi:MAG: hypothetical protein K9G09_02645 [Pontimonas sp.]|nr:hypothetical protein [Pontimonas sp.]
MNKDVVDLEALPLRFNPPDGWRMPDPLFISLHQGEVFANDWQPYPEAPPIPPSWPWWEENGTSWYRFFRDRAPLPARALGNWFSLSALGLLMFAVSPFALPGWYVAIGGTVSLVLLVLGIRGVIRTMKSQSAGPLEPLDAIRAWATERRSDYFAQAYASFRRSDPREISLETFIASQKAQWWGESSATAEN